METVRHSFIYSFADFSLDPTRRVLERNGESIVLHPKAFELLLALIENRDRILTKNELLNTVWEGQFVEENNLAVQISTLRKVFGEKREEHRFIVTVPGKGYRFVAKVSAENHADNDFFDTEFADNGFGEKTKTSFVAADVPLPKETLLPPVKRNYFLWLSAGIGLLVLFSGIFFWRDGDRSQPKQLKLTKLTASGKVNAATLTPDGSYAVFAQKDSDGESLWLKQIETGASMRIVAPQNLEYVGLTVSPDNRFIYYSVFQANQADTPLYRIPLLGGAAEKIAEIETGVSVSFSPDRRQFAFTESHAKLRETHLKIVDADGTNQQIVIQAKNESRIFETFRANPVAWSPSDAEIAVAVVERSANESKAGILLVDPISGGERFLLAPSFGWISNLVWTDAENVAFIAYNTDDWSSQVWTVSRKTGEARQLTNDLQKYLWLAAANGTLLTVQQTGVSRLQIADFDETSGEIKPREILNEAGIGYAAFGADGSILYVSQTTGKREIWRVDKSGVNPTQLTVDAQVTDGFTVSRLDGSIVFSGIRGGGKRSLWLADADGKNFRKLTDNDDIFPQFTPDGKSVVFQRGYIDNPTVLRIGINDKEPIQLVSTHSLKPNVSPDGSQTAYYFMDKETDGVWRIGLISTATGEFLGKLSFPQMVNERRMRWHPSGKFITQVFNTGETANLLLLPPDGGEARIISGLGKGKVSSFEWSPNGKQIVFSQTDETRDAVLLTNF